MRIVFVFSMALISGMLLAAPEIRFTNSYKTAFGYITQLRFQEARTIVAAENRMNPENRAGAYLEGAMLCAEIFANEDQGKFVDVQDRLELLMAQIEEVDVRNPFRNLFLGELYLAQATLNGKFKSNFKAAWQFYKAYNLLTENAENFPGFMPNKIPLGVLYAGIGSLPDDYRSMASLLGFEGSVQGGIAMVKKAFWQLSADEDLSFYRPYAGFVYSYITYQLGGSEQVSPKSLGLEVGNSSFLIYAQALIELDNGNAGQALEWLDNRPEGPQYFQFNYMDYLQGKILLGLEPKRSVDYFERYLENSKNGVYVKSTYRYLAWHYLLSGNERKADEMRESVFRKGNTNTGADKQALDEATQGFNATLIEARVLFDVGKYKKAEAILQNSADARCCKTPVERAEYFYRYGRIEQELENTEQAIDLFSRALAVANVASTFAVGNSALQLGVLYEEQGNAPKAREFYRKTLKYSGYPFYEGVHQKAKTGIARLK